MFVNKVRLLLLSGTAAIASTGTAHAQTVSTGTTAGTSISNTATVTYTVNGTAQTTNSTTATFVVDRKVVFTVVTDQTANTQVNLGQADAVTKFRVTNVTNDVQDFLLDSDQTVQSVGLVTGTDNFDMTNLRVFVDSNGNGVYDPGVDTATYIDELAPNASVEVFIIGNVPANPVSNQESQVNLHVTVAAGGAAGTKGAALVATDLNLANADATVDVVFADDDSDGAANLGDTARNGQGRAYAAYEVGARNVNLTVAKSATVLSDGVNTLNPKSLPGAVVEYCLRVNNATLLTPATNVTLSDIIPANTTYVPGSITSGVPGGTCVLAGTVEDDDADDAAEVDGVTANYASATNKITAVINTVLGGTTGAIAFRVKIN